VTIGVYSQASAATAGLDVGDFEDVVDGADLKFGLERDMQEAGRRTMRAGPPVHGALIALGTHTVVLGSCRRLVEIAVDRVARVDLRAAPSGGGPPSFRNVVGIGRCPQNPPDPSAWALSAKR
jgi:hypothetical protein